MSYPLPELATAYRRVFDSLCALASVIETRWEQDDPPLCDPAVRAAWHQYGIAVNAARDLTFAAAKWLPQLAAKHGRGEAGEWTEGAIRLLAFGISVGPNQVPVSDIERMAEQVGERWGFLERLRRYECTEQPQPTAADEFERQADERAELMRTILRVIDAAHIPPRGPHGELSEEENRLGWQLLTAGIVNNARVVPVELANRRLIEAGIRPPGFQAERWRELAVEVGFHPTAVDSAAGIRQIADAAIAHPLLPEHFRLPAPRAGQVLPADPPPAVPASEKAEGGPSADTDGPFDADGFRFAGVTVRFGRAPKRYALILALWDRERRTPTDPRAVQDVIDAVYGNENDTNDTTFRQLCSDTRTNLQKTNCPLDIRLLNGTIQLVRV